ncbi:FAD/NAD(P)-binding domain-containing protein [Panus rudis PR-1116 ss-1]|nr:FAD/NAD(P)-binding domain-containing protein [Panus rudis PR-1116 ss-1]
MDSPTSSERSLHQTVLPIDFVIIGGGIAGLCASIALTRAGHHVTLLEQSDDFDDTVGGGGIKVPPNMSKMLFRWGMHDEVTKHGLKSTSIELRRYESGDALSIQRWSDEIMSQAGGDFLTLHYADLRRILKNAADKHGITIHPNTKVVAISTSPFRKSSVATESGQTFEADVIIGADGVEGISRRTVVGQEERPSSMGLDAYHAVIPEDKLGDHPELIEMFAGDPLITWFGNKKTVVAYPIQSTKLGRCIVVTPYLPSDDSVPKGWDTQIPVSTLLEKLQDSNARLQALCRHATSISCKPVVQYPELSTWADQHGKLLVIGDAAHPFYPSGPQHPAMGVCDAATLGHLFHHLHHRSQIGQIIEGIIEVRIPRVAQIGGAEWKYLATMTLPDSEMQDTRDRRMKEENEAGNSTMNVEEGDIAEQWAMVYETFAYDAEDEADEWWMRWGSLHERATFRNITPGLTIEVKHEESAVSA